MVEFHTGQTVRIGSRTGLRATLTSIGVTGSVRALPPPAHTGSAAFGWRMPEALAGAIAEAGLRDLRADYLVSVERTGRVPGTRLLVDRGVAPPEDERWVALAVTGRGTYSWHPLVRAGTGRFEVGRREWSRGWSGPLLIKLFAFPWRTACPLAAYEERRHRYRLRACAPDTYARDVAEDLHPSRWAGLEAGEGGERRTLLLLHGAFGRTHSSFGGMPAEAFARLHAAYGGRVIAFDHHTLTHDPAENARRLIALIPDGADLHLDVLAHSRGGLVARELAQNAAALPLGRRRVRIGRVMFAGTPNAGTPLADPARLRHLAGRLTTLLAATGQAGPLGAVQELVKHLASGASGDLPGLTAMSPAGAYLRGLNAFGPHAHGPRPRYRALAAEYGPPGDDGVFGEGVGNDVVVPVAAVGAMGRTGRVPDTHVLERVHHHAYFESAAATRRILTWAAEAS